MSSHFLDDGSAPRLLRCISLTPPSLEPELQSTHAPACHAHHSTAESCAHHTDLACDVSFASVLPNPSCAPHGVETFSSTSASFSHLCALPQCAHCLGGPSVAPPPRPLSAYGRSLSGSWDLRMVHSQLCIAPGLKSGFELFKELKKSDRPHVAHEAISVYCLAFNRKHLNLTAPGTCPRLLSAPAMT